VVREELVIELLILVAAVFIVAGLAKHGIDWFVEREWTLEYERLERERRRSVYLADFGSVLLTRPNAHGVITGITS
jgi:hypothetical protein